MSWLDPLDIGGKIDSFMHPEKGYKKGRDELERYYNQGQSYLQPYSQFGQDAYGPLAEAMRRLLDPQSLQNEWMQGYTESPTAKYTEGLAREHGLDAASGLGLMGSNTALNAIQGGTTQIGLDDRNNYLNNLMQKYLAGTGIAGNIFNTGANAAGTMSNNAMNMGGNAAQLAFGAQNAPGDMFGKLLGTGVGYMTGGMNKNPGGAGNTGGWTFGGG